MNHAFPDYSAFQVKAPMTGDYFFGVALANDARRALQARIAPVELPGRVVAPVDWHITLRHLGKTDPEVLANLRTALRAADLGPAFMLTIGGFGAFPDTAAAGVLWLGLDSGANSLHALAARVNAAGRQAGFPDGHPSFTPHVTLSRLRPLADTRRLVQRFPPAQVAMAVDAVILFRTRPGDQPGRYQAVERYALQLAS